MQAAQHLVGTHANLEPVLQAVVQQMDTLMQQQQDGTLSIAVIEALGQIPFSQERQV